MKDAASSNLKNVTLELGGKSPTVICEDADIEKAAESCAFSIAFNSGQVCIASSRLYVHEKIYEEFLNAMQKVSARSAIHPDLVSYTRMTIHLGQG